MPSIRALIFALAAGILLVAAGIRLAIPSFAPQGLDSRPMVRLPGHVLAAFVRATVIPPVDARAKAVEAREPLTLTLVLKRDDQAGFERYLHDVYDPHSKNFHHYLTQNEIAERFGPSRGDYDWIQAYLRDYGFKLMQGSVNRLTLTVRGTHAGAEGALGTQIRNYEINGHRFFANESDPALPTRLAEHVQAIAGLSNLQRPRHAWIAAAINCASAYINNTACQGKAFGGGSFDYWKCVSTVFGNDTYNFTTGCVVKPGSSISMTASVLSSNPSVSWSGIDGTGQTIGLVEFDTFAQSDVVNYLAFSGLPAALISQLSEVPVNGGVSSPGSNQQEVLLDIDTTLSLASGAKTVVYDAPFSSPGASFQSILNQMLSDKVTIISNSWAYCENQTSLADAQSIDLIFQNAALGGVSVFNGAGDSGSTCLDGSADTVAVPADSPNATAVGGSSESPGPSFTYGPEAWWNDIATIPPAGQGGFGLSSFFPMPGYQSGFNTTGMRSIPDVVVNADPFHGTVICEASAGGCPNGLLYGGTSYAAPIWAAFTALMNQAQGSNLGFLNPRIYPLAKSAGFHDAAALGSDFAHVGLGSPNVNALSLLLQGKSAGTPSAALSTISFGIAKPANGISPTGVFADGKNVGYVTIQLRDANGNTVGGKTVTLSAMASSVKITPTSAASSTDNGAATFQVTDSVVENASLTATDTTDGVKLSPVSLPFIVPPAVSAGLDALPPTVTADGVSSSTITVTL